MRRQRGVNTTCQKIPALFGSVQNLKRHYVTHSQILTTLVCKVSGVPIISAWAKGAFHAASGHGGSCNMIFWNMFSSDGQIKIWRSSEQKDQTDKKTIASKFSVAVALTLEPPSEEVQPVWTSSKSWALWFYGLQHSLLTTWYYRVAPGSNKGANSSTLCASMADWWQQLSGLVGNHWLCNHNKPLMENKRFWMSYRRRRSKQSAALHEEEWW